MYIKVDKTSLENVVRFSIGEDFGFSGEFTKGGVAGAAAGAGDAGVPEFVSRLLALDGVEAVFVNDNFVSVTKGDGFSWGEVKPKVLSCVVDFLEVLDASGGASEGGSVAFGGAGVAEFGGDYVPADGLEKEIWNAIDQRVRPAIRNHGGDVRFFGLEDGFVLVRLVGACVGCSSADVTLKDGLERMLKQFFPSVKGVKEVSGKR